MHNTFLHTSKESSSLLGAGSEGGGGHERGAEVEDRREVEGVVEDEERKGEEGVGEEGIREDGEEGGGVGNRGAAWGATNAEEVGEEVTEEGAEEVAEEEAGRDAIGEGGSDWGILEWEGKRGTT